MTMSKSQVVCTPVVVFILVLGLAFWSMTIVPRERFSELSNGSFLGLEEPEPVTDCDVCVVVHVGDDGANPPSETNLPFPLLHRLFQTVKKIKKPAQRDKIVCVGVDHPGIVCKMVRDAFGLDANCWKFEEMPQRESPMICSDMVVGDTRKYLPQLSAFETQTSGNFTWQRMHAVDLDTEDPRSRAPAIANIRPTIVTGFSANHLTVGMLLLRSIAKATFDAKVLNPRFDVSVVVWLLEEMRGKDKEDLECLLKELDKKWELDVEVRRFKFWAYPQWMRIKQAHEGFNEFGTGEYAWKVVMIHTVLLERGMVLWQDAGDRFKSTEALTKTFDYIAKNGFASRSSDGSIAVWTYWEEILYLRATKLDRSQRNCDGSAVGFTLRRYEELARPWYECAITRQCIAPDGSSRKNHRQDQAALTVLSYLSNNTCTGIHPDVGVHMDNEFGDTVGAGPTSCYVDPR